LVSPRWRLRVDADACIGSGSCAGIAPRHFRLDGHVSTPVRETVAPDESVIAAAESCPAEAIFVYDTTDGSLVSG
jgi:ferredoxin